MSTLCGCRKPTSTPIPVGIAAQDTSSGGTTYACRTCAARHHIVPVDQWTGPGDGRPQFYPVVPTPR